MNSLIGKTILVTSGPTYAPIDAVRCITNRSTGRLGSTITRFLLQADAHVVQLAGELSLTVNELYPHESYPLCQVIRFGTVDDLKRLMVEWISKHSVDAVIMSAAVLDYLPADPEPGKKRSSDDEWVIKLTKGEKIIEQIRTWNSQILIVGFKLETQLTLEELKECALNLMQRSDSAIVVANLVEEIAEKKHIAYIMERGKENIIASSPLQTREEIAKNLCQSLAQYLR